MYKVSIIGAGNKGALSDAPGTGNEHKYLSYCHACVDHPGFEVSAISDISASCAIKALEIWGVDIFKISRFESTDVFVIATPDDKHLIHLEYILMYCKPKLVICEKPIHEDFEKARKIVDKYKEAGIPLMIDYTRRFIPAYRIVKNSIDNLEFGKFIKGYLYFNRGWEHTASHFIDLALWYNGSLNNIEIKEVKTDYQWIFQWGLFYGKSFISEHAVDIKTKDVNTIYDRHLMYVMENAYDFLEGREKLMCTGKDGLRALEETLNMKGMK